jgi:hypothetical protein
MTEFIPAGFLISFANRYGFEYFCIIDRYIFDPFRFDSQFCKFFVENCIDPVDLGVSGLDIRSIARYGTGKSSDIRRDIFLSNTFDRNDF